MNPFKLIITLAALIPASWTFGEWTLVNALNESADLEKIVTIDYIPAGSEETPGESAIVPDPLGALRELDGSVAMVYRGTVGADPDTRYVQRFLFPDPSPLEHKWTWYHRFMLPEGAVNSWQELNPLTDWGLGEDENPLARGLGIWWHNWPPTQFFGLNQAGQWGPARDAGGTAITFEFNTWYEYFIVVDPLSATLSMYIRGGEFQELTLLHENALWTNLDLEDPFRSLQQIFVGGEAGSGPQYYNSMYLDYTGENLTRPEGLGSIFAEDTEETWAGFVVGTDGYADTGSLLGQVYVVHQPWIYSAKLGQWLFIEEDFVSESGSWVFAPRK